MKLTSGPNWQFYAVSAFWVYLSIEKQSVWPVVIWLGFCLLLIPVSLALHRWNRKQDRKLAEEFPHDPLIQEKYGDK